MKRQKNLYNVSIPGAAVTFAGGKSVVEGVQSKNGSGTLPSVLLPSGTP